MMSSNRQTVTKRMGTSRLTGCEQVENKSWRWVSTVWMDGMGSRNVVRLTYTGFCLGFGVETRVWVQSPGQTILGGSGGGGQFGTGETGGFVGELGWMLGIYDTGLV